MALTSDKYGLSRIGKSKVEHMTFSETSSLDFELRAIEECIVCKAKQLVEVLNLGEQFIIDFVDDRTTKSNNFKAPLVLVLCLKCGLVQLKHVVPRDIMYRRYWYRSGVSPLMIKALREIVASAERVVKLKPNDVVVDIGANDGTLLRQYSRHDLHFVGFEPARNLAGLAKDVGDIVNDYFNASAFSRVSPNRKARIVTAVAMFYDLENPNAFLQDIRTVLDHEGLFVIQMNYLGTMLERNTFDNVCHEHLAYYSLSTLCSLLERNSLEAFDVELNDVNGGSFRIYVRHKDSQVGGAVTQNVKKLIRVESEKGFAGTNVYEQFARNVREISRKLHDFLSQEVENGKRIYIIGASTRGNTILQYAGINKQLIAAAADRNPEKWGKQIIGAGIPIISKEQARREHPDYFLVLPYGFLEEIRAEEKEYLNSDGKLILPIPFPHIVTRKGELRI